MHYINALAHVLFNLHPLQTNPWPFRIPRRRCRAPRHPHHPLRLHP